MAMNNEQGPLTLINDLVDELLGEETLAAKKANTVVSAIGGTVTILGTAAAYMVESETNLPSWFPMVVTILGILGTILKTNKTANGFTPSVAAKLQNKLGEKIDVEHYHELQAGPAPVYPQYPEDRHAESQYQRDYVSEIRGQAEQTTDSLRNAAESIINNAANRR